MFEIKILDTRKTRFEDVLQKYELLPKKRKEKANRLKNEVQKVACVEAYHLVLNMLQRTDFPEFETNKFGKPFLFNEKHFNISHSHGVIVVVVDENQIGVDIEKQKEFSNELSNYVFSQEELESVKGLNNTNQALTKIWTQKESLIKLEGKTIGTNLKTVLENQQDYNFSFSSYEDFEICVCQKK